MSIKQKLYIIIFEADTKLGKLFDIILIWSVIISVMVVMLESVMIYQIKYKNIFNAIEYFFTILFTLEYLLRLYVSPKKKQYFFSFFGLIDLFSILPFFISFFIPSLQSLLSIRSLRLVRIFRVLKLSRYNQASNYLLRALNESRPKITVFLLSVLSLAIIFGTIMYIVEGGENGFTSIPKSVYWAIVTMTTVGFGDIVPKSPLGQFISSFLMILGYGIIAVPTGIVTAQMTNLNQKLHNHSKCSKCNHEISDLAANYCGNCGNKLNLNV